MARQSSTRLEFGTGLWQDKVNNLDGIVNGTVRADGFDILLSGNFFDAKMTVVNSPCQQSLTIVLEEGLPVKKTRCDAQEMLSPQQSPELSAHTSSPCNST